ncbi:MAG: VOC family protein [Pirellulaceae bacterium]
MQMKQKITPFLSFNNQAEEAADFYVSILPDSKIIRTIVNPQNNGVLTVEFQLAGITFVALNVGQSWEFTDAFSLAVSCDSQDELDDLWAKLSAGGREIQCGWLKDKFGVSWQVVPAVLSTLLGDPDAAKTQRVMGALMQMVKLDIEQLQRAYADQ